MIITCVNCHKKFDVNSDLILDNGRLVQCGSCDHRWFFKIHSTADEKKTSKINDIVNFENLTPQVNPIEDKLNKVIENESPIHESNNNLKKINKSKKNHNILNLIIVFIVSFVALIILIDTFKYPISIIMPDIEFILYNLYETIKDIVLFFNDLI